MMDAFGRKFDSSEELYMMAVMVDRMFGLVEMAGRLVAESVPLLYRLGLGQNG